MRYLLDTNILSEARKTKPSPKVLDWLLHHGPACAISVLTIGELVKGASLLPNSQRRRKLDVWIAELEAEFCDRLLPFDIKVARTWGTLYGNQQAAGRQPPLFDSLLAATAAAHGLVLVTRNTADFPTGTPPVLNPFER